MYTIKWREWDEEVLSVITFVVLVLVTRNFWIALVPSVIVYVVFWAVTPRQVEEAGTALLFSPSTQPQEPSPEPVTQPKVAKIAKRTFGDIEISPGYFLNVLSDSIFITALKGFGKSVLLYTILLDIHKNYEPKDLQVVIIDLKETAFNLFARSPFVVNNKIYSSGDGIDAVETLLDQRKSEYLKLSDKYLVDNLAKYHKVKADDQPTFPYIVVMIDEAQLLDDQDNASRPNLNRVDKINKISRAYGILFILATQRGATYIPRRMLSQFDTRAVGYMSEPTEYKYAGLNNEAIAAMSKKEGLFAVGNKNNEFVIVQTHNTKDKDVEELASTFSEIKPILSTSTIKNNILCMNWFNTLDTKPTIDEIQSYFQCEAEQARTFAKLWRKS